MCNYNISAEIPGVKKKNVSVEIKEMSTVCR